MSDIAWWVNKIRVFTYLHIAKFILIIIIRDPNIWYFFLRKNGTEIVNN